LDGRKGLAMFKMMEVPVLGFVENMSYFQPPGSSERFEIFGHGGGRRLAEEAGVPFLGEIPLDQQVRIGGDIGKPVVIADPDCSVARSFFDIAKQVAAQVSIKSLAAVG
jgi:ATP-binding protein involved in chromosome partitioning